MSLPVLDCVAQPLASTVELLLIAAQVVPRDEVSFFEHVLLSLFLVLIAHISALHPASLTLPVSVAALSSFSQRSLLRVFSFLLLPEVLAELTLDSLSLPVLSE